MAETGIAGLFARIALYVLLGTPLVAYVWETLNRLLAGHFDGVRLLITVPVAILLWVLLRAMAGSVHSWEGRHTAVHGG